MSSPNDRRGDLENVHVGDVGRLWRKSAHWRPVAEYAATSGASGRAASGGMRADPRAKAECAEETLRAPPRTVLGGRG